MSVFVVMVNVGDTLHDAVSSSIVQICRELFSLHSFVMVTGSLMFDVDGQQVNMLFSALAVYCVCYEICSSYMIVQSLLY